MWPKRWTTWLLALTLPALMALISTSQSYLNWMGREPDVYFDRILVPSLVDWYTTALFVPLILWLLRRFPPEGRRWWLGVAIHVPGSVLFLVSQQFLFLSIDTLVGRFAGPFYSYASRYAASFKLPSAGLFVVLFHLIPRSFYYSFLMYVVLVSVAGAIELYRRYRDRELLASKLEARLARTRLQVLTMQLQPHFLFNTLNTISALMHQDVPAADRVVSRLGDLLRRSLRQPEIQLIPLEQELETLRLYLEIEQTRYADRLQVSMKVDPAALEVKVPCLILQPLAENAIKHGISRLTRPGRIELTARLDDHRLRLHLANDGPPLPSGALHPPEGLGLRNTRLRLDQLYGPAAALEFEWAGTGGASVTLDLPLTALAATP